MDCFKYINGSTFTIVTQIFFFIFLLSASKPVEADDDAKTLVKILCDQSLQPDICYDCVSSDTSRECSNVSDVANSVLHCYYDRIMMVHMSAETLISEGPGVDPTLKALQVCKDGMFLAMNTVLDGISKMEASDYKGAHTTVRIANLELRKCVFAYREYANFPITPSMLCDMVPAKRMFDVAQFMFLLLERQWTEL